MADLERSGAARNGLPEFKPYRYNGTGGTMPPREIVTRLHEQIAAESPEHAALVAGYARKQAERTGADCAGPGAGWDPPDDDELAEAAPEPGPTPPPLVTAGSRCGRCGYLTTAAGHRVTCDE